MDVFPILHGLFNDAGYVEYGNIQECADSLMTKGQGNVPYVGVGGADIRFLD